MKRELNKISNTEYDVIVIGAGIYGVSTAWDATLRGLKVALIDKDDFAGATSSNSLKTIHGGLRYLQNLDFKRMRQSIRERMVLMNIAPHLVFPLPIVMPTYSYKLKSRPALFAALLANDLIGFDRNRVDDPDKYLPRSRLISKKKVMEYLPGYEKTNMSGGALWYDCQCHNTERLVLSYALSAAGLGADLANYVKCTGFLRQGNEVVGIKAKDLFSGDSFDIRAKIIVNTSGPWVDEVLNKISGENSKPRFFHSSAMNIVIKRRILDEYAAGLPGPYHYKREDGSVYNGSQILFFVPWKDYTIIGTRHLPYYGDPSEYSIKEIDILEFLSAVNKTYPQGAVKREEVAYVHGGLLPMTGVNQSTGNVNLEKHYKIHDHRMEDNIEGLITVVGVKYTTHRYVAGKTVDLVFNKLRKTSPECTTDNKPVYGGDVGRFKDYLAGALQKTELNERITRHLVYTYGSNYRDILDYAGEDSGLIQTVPDSDEVLKAEVINGVRNEMAMKLSDVILRRTDLGSAGNPGDETLCAVADIMGNELGWDRKRIKDEIDETAVIYALAN
jgi:glycerol-3-phosphate dehydrogenase